MNFDFIMVPAVCGIIFYFFYRVMDLLVRKKERLFMIEKIQDISSVGDLNISKVFGEFSNSNKFLTLRLGYAFLGIGIGLLFGFILDISFGLNVDTQGQTRDIAAIAYGSSTLLFGGLAMILCFLYEQRKIQK